MSKLDVALLSGNDNGTRKLAKQNVIVISFAPGAALDAGTKIAGPIRVEQVFCLVDKIIHLLKLEVDYPCFFSVVDYRLQNTLGALEVANVSHHNSPISWANAKKAPSGTSLPRIMDVIVSLGSYDDCFFGLLAGLLVDDVLKISRHFLQSRWCKASPNFANGAPDLDFTFPQAALSIISSPPKSP